MCVDLSDWATARKTVEDIGPIDLLVNDAAIFTNVSFFEADEIELNKYESILCLSDTF